MEKINIDFIYIAHYEKLTQRKQYLLHEFNKYNITNFAFFTNYAREKTSRNDIKKFIKREVSDNEFPYICNFMNHFSIYLDIIKNNYKKVLIIEDDAILCPNFLSIFNKYIEKLPSDWDMTFLHDGCNMHASNIRPDIIWYKEIYSRTVCSYMLTLETAKKIVETLLPIDDHPYIAIDNCLNEEIQKHNLNVYWCEPVIIKEGSQNNFYNSTYVRLS